MAATAGMVRGQDQPQTPTPTPTPTEPVQQGLTTSIRVLPSVPGEADPQTVAFLDELERTELTSLASDITSVRFFEIGDTQVRGGMLYYLSEPTVGDPAGVPTRRFAVRFSTLVTDPFDARGGRSSAIERSFIFDGRVLTEIDQGAEPKLFKRREVIGPGEVLDPLSLDGGIFPLPIGQRRDEILERFEAELQESQSGLRPGADGDWTEQELAFFDALARTVASCRQLVLRPLDPDADAREIRLWYEQREGLWVPRLARTLDVAGDASFIILREAKLNVAGSVPGDVIRVEPPADATGWLIPPIERFRQREPDVPSAAGPNQQREPRGRLLDSRSP